MKETQWIFIAVASFGMGYYAGYLTHNISRIIDRFGLLASIVWMIIFIVLVVQIVSLLSILISIIFALGFLLKMFKR
jgi:ABC-type dipeptide/oligopeptide/nickel transport system permease subunit